MRRPSLPLAIALFAPVLAAQHTICTLRGPAAFDLMGTAVASAGDVDRDGVPDLIVGASQRGGIGYARVLSGSDARVLHVLRGRDFDDKFGHAVAGIGDVDRDGYADVVVGAPEDCG